MQDLTPESDYGKAFGINNRGQIVGERRVTSASTTQAFLWDHGQMLDLSVPGSYASSSRDINSAGVTVGGFTALGALDQACVWHDGVMSMIGTQPGAEFSEARAINDRGQIVGTEEWPRISSRDMGTMISL